MHEKGLLLAACPYLILRAQSLHILTCIIRSVLWRADTKWCVSESFRNQICWQDGLQPDVCSINTAIASCKDSGRTSVNSREIEKEFVRCTALLNLINSTWHCILGWTIVSVADQVFGWRHFSCFIRCQLSACTPMQMVWVQRLLLVKAVVFVLRCLDY